MEQLRAEQRACRLAGMRRRLGITQADVAAPMGVTQSRAATRGVLSDAIRQAGSMIMRAESPGHRTSRIGRHGT